MFKKILFSSLLGLLLWNCSIAPKDINYGSDACHYCRMTIVDQAHASQLVTKTGKAFSFDAIECLAHHLEDQPNIAEGGLLLVNHLDQPGTLIDATTATYLISPNLPSPMGANLTAFSTKQTAQEGLTTYGGTLFSWEELLKKLQN